MKFDNLLSTIDTHTAGGPTRIVTGGVPRLTGQDMGEKMEVFRTNHDSLRKLLMREPRGHGDMSGAVLAEPVNPEADAGAFFITASGYLPACVHSSIGIAVAGLSAGFIARDNLKVDGRVRLEVPAGLISLTPIWVDGEIRSMSVQTAPAFVAVPRAEIDLGDQGKVEICVAFSGLFFALVDIGRLGPLKRGHRYDLQPENAAVFVSLGADILAAANETLEFSHPEKPELRSVELVMFYEGLDDNRGRDIVINANGGVDRSPCGAGMGALLAELISREQLAIGDNYVLESFLGTRFSGRGLQATKVASLDAVVPQIEGAAYITGMHQFVLDSQDPLREGFVV